MNSEPSSWCWYNFQLQQSEYFSSPMWKSKEKSPEANDDLSRQLKSAIIYLPIPRDYTAKQEVVQCCGWRTWCLPFASNTLKKCLPVKAKILAHQLRFCIFANDIIVEYSKYRTVCRKLCPSMSAAHVCNINSNKKIVEKRNARVKSACRVILSK